MMQSVLSEQEKRNYEKLPIPFCIFEIQKDSCQMLVVSDGFCRAFRAERSAFSAPCRELLARHIHPDDFQHFRSDLESACLNPSGQYSAIYRIRGSENEAYRWLAGKGSVERQVGGSYLLYVYFSDVNDETELQREEADDRLRQDMLLADILSTTKTAIFWKDADRRFLGANKAFLDYYGFADENEIIGKNDEEMGWHTEPDPFKNDELCVLRDGISTYRVHGKCLAKGENRDIVASKSPLIIDGKIVGLVGSFEDVTKETKQQTEIERLNAALEEKIRDRDLLMSISEVCIVKVELKGFTITEYNDAMCRMIGCTRDEYENRYHCRMDTFFAGEYRSELETLKRLIKENLAAGKDKFSLNLHMPTARGPVWVGGSVSFTDPDPVTHRPQAVYAVYRDITDIMEAQRKIEQAEIEIQKTAILEAQLRKMRSMIDGVPSGIGALRITDGKAELKMQLNRYFTERIQIAVDQNGMADLEIILDAVHPEDRERFDSDYHELRRTKNLMSRQYRFRAKDGNFVWIGVRGIVVRLTEKVEIAYFTYTNINEMKITEKKLKESQRFYREVVQAAKLSTWEYDLESHTIRMSDDRHTQNMANLLALPKTIENVPDSLIPLISEEDQPVFSEMYRKVGQGQNASCEAWYKPVNGREPRCERITYIAVPNPEGGPKKAIGFSQNITADRKVAERYQRELGYLRQTDENNLGAKGHYDLTKNLVLEYTTKNDSFFKIQPGIPYDDAYHAFLEVPYQDPEKNEIADKLNRKKLMERYQHGQMQTSLIYHRARRGALPMWISLNIHTYMSPETGDLEAFTYAYDVTGKMETDEIIGLISEEEFDYIGIIYADSDEFEFVRKSSAIQYGAESERVCYSKACDYVCRTFVGETERGQYETAVVLGNIVEMLQKNGGRHTATYLRTEEGKTRCKQVSYVWLEEPANIILAVRSDVTATYERDQQQLARIEAARLEAERANEAKSTFLSSMSHDLRTPLNGVIGFTELALKEPGPEKKQEYLEKIRLSGKLLLDLVNDTLELSRMESGKAALEPEAVMPEHLIPAVVTALQPSAELKGIHLCTEYRIDMKTPVWCDRLKVQKIALNLISNAIKYTPEGGTVTVRVLPESARRTADKWLLYVEDNGIGMSAEFMQRMFEPFAQEKRSESLKTPGTGLGLSIVKRYVDLMGGTIDAKSVLHKGTVWTVVFPICRVPAGKEQNRKEEAAVKSLSGMHVLLCEDNYMNTEIAVMLLKDRGILTDTAENGEAGVRLFSSSEEGYYSAVLMDLRMPVMDGNTAARTIRALGRPDAKSVPIIAMSADNFEESIREAEESGMNGYLTKPIEPQKLFEVLQTYSIRPELEN
jgi:PAS domain S-box-containing protein